MRSECLEKEGKRERESNEKLLIMYYYRILYRIHLNSSFREINLHRQIFPRKNVRIVSLREGRLKFLQLLKSEGCPISPLFPPNEGILANSM